MPSWCHRHSLSLASVKSRLVLPFWYRPTRVVLEKGPLNGCVCVCVLNCSLNYHYYRCCCWCAIWLSLAVLCWLLLVYVVIICRRCGYWCRLHRSTTCRTHRVFQFVSQAASVRTRHSRSPRKYSTVRSYLLWHAIDNMLKLGIALRQKAIMLCSLKVQNLWQCCNMISFNGFGYVFKKFPHIYHFGVVICVYIHTYIHPFNVFTSLQRDDHARPAPNHSVFYRHALPAAQPTVSYIWKLFFN